MERQKLVEIKAGETGYGLLLERDGFIASEVGDNKALYESVKQMDGDNWHVPHPFIIDTVFQKSDTENANKRIYPHDILAREIDKYIKVHINNNHAYAECYKPDTMILTLEGWKTLAEVHEGDDIITLNTETNTVETKPVLKKIEHDYDGDMIHISNKNMEDVVTPDHRFPIYNNAGEFVDHITASELMKTEKSAINIPCKGGWNGKIATSGFVLPLSNSARIEDFCKFYGLYTSNGTLKKNKVLIHHSNSEVCTELKTSLLRLGVDFRETVHKNGSCVFSINDKKIVDYVSQYGITDTERRLPPIIKILDPEKLNIFYEWYLLGNEKLKLTKQMRQKISPFDAISISKQLIYDLNEIQFKLGHTATITTDSGLVYFSKCNLNDYISLSEDNTTYSVEHYTGPVMCVDVENHTWFTMTEGKGHWTSNCNHPPESVIDLSRICINVEELHWENHTVVGKVRIITSEAFRRYGAITCQGDQVANLIIEGLKVGVSSRGLGSVESRYGKTYVCDNYELICFDVVSEPSTPNAWICSSGDPNEKNLYIENTKNRYTPLSEEINRLKKILL